MRSLECRRRHLLSVALLFAALAATPAASYAQSAGSFYAGKTVRILIGFGVGGQYGQFARLAATHLHNHVPGKPTFVVQSMPGASGLTAMQYVTTNGPQDGTVVALVTLGVMQEGMLEPGTKFDPAKLAWIGRMATVAQVGLASTKGGLKSIEDAKVKEYVVGGLGLNSLPTMNYRLINALAGTKFKIVTGYKGTAEAHLALQRGEIDTYNNAWDIVRTRYPAELKDGRYALIFLNGRTSDPALPKMPNIADLARNDVERAFMKIYTLGPELGRSLVTSTKVPADRIATLRAGFGKMLADPAFKADAEKQGIGLEPLDGAGLEKLAAGVTTLPADTVTAARVFYTKLLEGAR
jgi:tripartite-type tricarboxylate transporter receptor subunit TctC